MSRKKENFVKWCDRVMAWSFYPLIYFFPISIALVESFASISLVTYFIKRGGLFVFALSEKKQQGTRLKIKDRIFLFFKSYEPASSFLSKPVGLFIFVNALTIVFSQYPHLSFKGFFFKILQGTFLYFTFIESINTKKRLKIFIVTFLVSTALVSINGLWQRLLGHGFIHGHIYEGQVSSSLRQANDFGAYLICVIPVLFCLITSVRDMYSLKNGTSKTFAFDNSFSFWLEILLSMLFILAMYCLCLTSSRGAWLGLMGGMVLLNVMDRKIFPVSALIMIVFLMISYFYMLKDRPDIKNFNSLVHQDNRFLYWKGPPKIIKDYPVLGSGVNTYSMVERQYNIDWGGYPHNCYLQMTAETGILGLLSFLWIVFTILVKSFRNYYQVDDPLLKTLLLGGLCGLFAFLIHSFFDTNFYSVQLGNMMWVMMGIVVAAQLIDRKMSSPPGA